MRSSRLSKKGTYRLSETCLSDRWGDCGGGGEVLDWFRIISLVWVWPRIWVSCVILSWKWLQYLVILANAISIQEDAFMFARCIYIFFYRVMSYFYNSQDLGSIPGSGRSPGEGNGNPLQYSCLENPMDGGAWGATVHEVAKSQTRLCNFTFTFTCYRRSVCVYIYIYIYIFSFFYYAVWHVGS